MDPAPQPRHDGDGQVPDAHEEARDEPAHPRPPLRRRLRRLGREHPRLVVLLLIGLVVAVAAGVLIWWYFHTRESTDDAQIDGHIAPVSSRINGTVTGVFVEDNQTVQRGQLLVELDPRDYQVALDRAQAELAQARAALDAESPNVPITATTNVTQIATSSDEVVAARAAIMAAERDYQSAVARVHAAEANATRAEADLARTVYLLGQRAVPKERYDEVLANTRAARADVESARALARSAQKGVDQQRARLSRRRAARAKRTRTRPISSPFARPTSRPSRRRSGRPRPPSSAPGSISPTPASSPP